MLEIIVAVFAYVAPSLSNPEEDLARDRQEIAAFAEQHGLSIDREYVEAPGDFRVVAIGQRPVGRELFASLRRGDVLVVDGSMVPRSQLVRLVSEMAKRGVALRLMSFEPLGISAEQLAEFLRWHDDVERRRRSRRAIDTALLLRVEGRSTGGHPGPGRKVVRDRRGQKKLVVDPEQRPTMMEIVKHHLNGKGFRQIATLLTKNNVRWKRPDRSRRNGFTWEPWGASRCERAYHAMLKILAEESRAAQAGGESKEQPPGDDQSGFDAGFEG